MLTEKLANDIAAAAFTALVEKTAVSVNLPKNIWGRSGNLIYRTVHRAMTNPSTLSPTSILDSRLKHLATRVNNRGYGPDNARLVKFIDDAANQAKIVRMHSPTGHAGYRALGEALENGTARRHFDNAANAAKRHLGTVKKHLIVGFAPHIASLNKKVKQFETANDLAGAAKDAGLFGYLKRYL